LADKAYASKVNRAALRAAARHQPLVIDPCGLGNNAGAGGSATTA